MSWHFIFSFCRACVTSWSPHMCRCPVSTSARRQSARVWHASHHVDCYCENFELFRTRLCLWMRPRPDVPIWMRRGRCESILGPLNDFGLCSAWSIWPTMERAQINLKDQKNVMPAAQPPIAQMQTDTHFHLVHAYQSKYSTNLYANHVLPPFSYVVRTIRHWMR